MAVDTSVVVAAFFPWHEGHEVARRVLSSRPRLPAHCAIESYSVLTRLPAPHRVEAGLAGAFLADRFPEAPVVLGADAHAMLVGRLVDLGITGGACYDALVALTAASVRATLLTRDLRATPIYERLGVAYELV